jgi:RHS repeat-associated protein
LTEVERPDGQKVTFEYDPVGRRRSKRFGERTTAYVWDRNDVVHEVTEGDPLVTWEFEPETFAPLAKVEGDKRYAVVTDHLGTPQALFDEVGQLAWRAQLDIYGVAHTDVMRTDCPWRWPGQYEDDETGLYYNRFRHYDPQAGMYINQDPIGLEGGKDLYAYVPDPFRWIDPYGLTFRGPARVATEWEHIFERHWYGGAVAKHSGIKDVFGVLEKHEIKQVVDLAWRLRKKIETEGTRIGYQATVKNRLWSGLIEMWFDTETKTLRAAYPKKRPRKCK